MRYLLLTRTSTRDSAADSAMSRSLSQAAGGLAAHRSPGDTEQPGDLVVRELLVVAQHEYHPLARRQVVHRAPSSNQEFAMVDRTPTTHYPLPGRPTPSSRIPVMSAPGVRHLAWRTRPGQ